MTPDELFSSIGAVMAARIGCVLIVLAAIVGAVVVVWWLLSWWARFQHGHAPFFNEGL